MKKRIHALFLTAVLATGISFSNSSCRAVAQVATAAAVVAVATHVAIHAATWYAVTRPVYVYPAPRTTQVDIVVPQGSRVYVVRESRDRRWVQVRTEDGRYGWVPANRFYARRYR